MKLLLIFGACCFFSAGFIVGAAWAARFKPQSEDETAAYIGRIYLAQGMESVEDYLATDSEGGAR